MHRRSFLKLGSSSALAFGAGSNRAFAAPLSPEALYAKFVPADKGLAAAWIASLTTRGHALDAAITHGADEADPGVIGMTVGGICCGTVYLSGDGRLWVWDVFNQPHEGVVANRAPIPAGLKNISAGGKDQVRERDGANFIRPPRASEHTNGVDSGFTLGHEGRDFPLDATGWDEVRFTGRWPMGIVDYRSEKTPLTVRLEAYSPFIPLRFKDSSLPVTILEYTIGNPGDGETAVTLSGRLNNPVGRFSKRPVRRISEAFGETGLVGIQHSVEDEDPGKPGGRPLGDEPDWGTMALACLSGGSAADPERGHVNVSVKVPAKGRVTVRFAIAWHFPNLPSNVGVPGARRHYTRDFTDARAVIAYLAAHHERLAGETRAWVDTWNDSTLPQWLLDRTILTANTLQTQNCMMFDSGRFWAWEGIGCCPGTCGHVWQYSQGHARLFPEIERNIREVTDFAIALQPDGSIAFRGSSNRMSAVDAQCSYILRTLRDHQLSDDPGYLKRVWEPAKKAIRYLVEFDRSDPRGGLDGLLDGKQHNTLDAEWYGKVHVLCSMYLAALRAGEELAKDMGDTALATELRMIFEMGSHNIARLYNGEFFIQIEDPAHATAIGVGTGCYIDQVMGQFWANQTGLGRLCHAEQQKSALRALWKYNFVPDYGVFRSEFREGRHYASGGDSGLLMCTWPKGGMREDFRKHWQYAYFNEFMTGFEYQAAAHMIAERDDDLVRNGLAITRAIHDRYSAKRGRNPYNEIECSDHYARAGSSYAVFLALCGFEYDQSKGRLAFDPVIQKDHFKAAFTTSKAWGSYEQKDGRATLRIAYGELRIDQLDLALFRDKEPTATLNGETVVPHGLDLRKGDVLKIG